MRIRTTGVIQGGRLGTQGLDQQNHPDDNRPTKKEVHEGALTQVGFPADRGDDRGRHVAKQEGRPMKAAPTMQLTALLEGSGGQASRHR